MIPISSLSVELLSKYLISFFHTIINTIIAAYSESFVFELFQRIFKDHWLIYSRYQKMKSEGDSCIKLVFSFLSFWLDLNESTQSLARSASNDENNETDDLTTMDPKLYSIIHVFCSQFCESSRIIFNKRARSRFWPQSRIIRTLYCMYLMWYLYILV